MHIKLQDWPWILFYENTHFLLSVQLPHTRVQTIVSLALYEFSSILHSALLCYTFCLLSQICEIKKKVIFKIVVRALEVDLSFHGNAFSPYSLYI